MTDRSNLLGWVERLHAARVLVVGDVMLDRYVNGETLRISPEAPVPVLRSTDTKTVLGGAGNVTRNLCALGSRVTFVSVVGDDPEAEEIGEMLSKPVRVESRLVVESRRVTTVKTRFMSGRQQMLRVDRETDRPIDSRTETESLHVVASLLDSADVVILSDYGKGFLCRDMSSRIIDAARDKGKAVLVDPKGADYSCYRRATVLTPNLKELKEATRLPVGGDDEIVTAANSLIDSCGVDAVLVTRSQEGMTLVQASGDVRHLRAEAREVFDVSGAGDTVISILAAAFGAGASLPEAAELSNIGAGIVVGKVGTAVAYRRELIQALHHRQLSGIESKVLDAETALERVQLWRRKGYKVGFTNGVFDLLHPGHLRLLSEAERTCDRLIVGLNGDMSVRQIKGEDPVQSEVARSAVLASLEMVDMVVIFQEETPRGLLESFRPDVLIKGGNYRLDEVVGRDVVESYGGRVVLAEIADVERINSKIARITNGML